IAERLVERQRGVEAEAGLQDVLAVQLEMNDRVVRRRVELDPGQVQPDMADAVAAVEGREVRLPLGGGRRGERRQHHARDDESPQHQILPCRPAMMKKSTMSRADSSSGKPSATPGSIEPARKRALM